MFSGKQGEINLFTILSIFLCCEQFEDNKPRYVPLQEVLDVNDGNFLYLFHSSKEITGKKTIINIESLIKFGVPKIFQPSTTSSSKKIDDGVAIINKAISNNTVQNCSLLIDHRNTYLIEVLKKYFEKFINNTIEWSQIDPQLRAERQIELISGYTLSLLKRQKPSEMMICEEQLNNSLPPEDRFPGFSESDITFSFLHVFGTLHLCGFITITDLYHRHHNRENQYWYLAVNFKINTPPSHWKVNEIIKRLAGITVIIPSLNIINDFSYDNGQLHFILIDGTPKSVDFSHAKEQRKIFEVFWYQWKADNRKEHTPEEIIEAYQRQKHEVLLESEIGEKVVNARNKIINLVSNRINWYFEKSTGNWIFEVLSLNKQS
jgi:hypothetical protein